MLQNNIIHNYLSKDQLVLQSFIINAACTAVFTVDYKPNNFILHVQYNSLNFSPQVANVTTCFNS